MSSAGALAGQDLQFVSRGECDSLLRHAVTHQLFMFLQLRMRALRHKLFQVPTRGYHDLLAFIVRAGWLDCLQSRHHCLDHYPRPDSSSVKGCWKTPCFGVGSLSRFRPYALLIVSA
jgi:hypothetical protein